MNSCKSFQLSHHYTSPSHHLLQLGLQINMNLRESITKQTDVSLILAKRVFSKKVHGDTNMVLSPLSIQILLGIIAAGCKGPTQHQLLSFLKSQSIDELNSLYSHLVSNVFVDGSSNGGPRLSVANSVWIDQTLPFKPSFKQVVDQVYKGSSESVDFQNKAAEVVDQVNEWAKTKTNDLIRDILPHGAVNNMTRLILANAIYFKGAWSEKFNASETKDHKFHLLSGSPIQVPFMTSKKKQYIAAFDGFKVLALPYKQGTDTRRFSMYFILPDAHDGLPTLLDKVSSEPGYLNRHVPYEKVKVGKFLVPKFKITFGFEASNILKGLGLTLPFVGGGLTEIVDLPLPERLSVSQVFHKSFIEVNEEGTEAAAVTAMVFKTTSLRIEKVMDFVADHPFLFVIRDESTGAVLFIGTVMNPLAG